MYYSDTRKIRTAVAERFLPHTYYKKNKHVTKAMYLTLYLTLVHMSLNFKITCLWQHYRKCHSFYRLMTECGEFFFNNFQISIAVLIRNPLIYNDKTRLFKNI